MRPALLACTFLAFLSPTIHAQPSSTLTEHSRCQVFGRVIAPVPLPETGFKIELVGPRTVPRQKTEVVNGAFEFKAVPPGVYQFRILDVSGKEVAKRAEQLSGKGDEIFVRVPLGEQDPSVANMVSLRQLGRKINENAVKAFLAGQKAVESGEILKSVEDFQNATSLDAHFAEAEGNLAVQYMLLGHEQEALLHARAAYELDPERPEIGHDLAVLLIQAKHYCEAETVLRRILKTQHNAELIAWLAVSLIGQSRVDEAFKYLKAAATEFPMARLLAANVLVETSAVTLAMNQVKEYMSDSASECERRQLEQWMASVSNSARSDASK